LEATRLSNGEIRVMWSFSPRSNSKLSNQLYLKLDNFRFLFEKKAYLMGQIVHGVLIWNVNQTTSVNNLVINVRGIQSVHTESKHASHGPNLDNRSTREYTFFNCSISVFNDEETIAPGFHTFPVKFKIPQDITPSFYYAGYPSTGIYVRGETLYEFRAKLDGSKPIDWISAPFLVYMDAKGFELSKSISPPIKEGIEEISVTITEIPSHFITGNSYQIQFEVENMSHLKIHSAQVSLIQKFLLPCCETLFTTDKNLLKIKIDKSYFPVTTGKSKQFSFDLLVPNKLILSRNSAVSPLFQVEYWIKIKTFLCGGIGSSTVGAKACSYSHLIQIVNSSMDKKFSKNNLYQQIASENATDFYTSSKSKLQIVRKPFELKAITIEESDEDSTNFTEEGTSDEKRSSRTFQRSLGDFTILEDHDDDE